MPESPREAWGAAIYIASSLTIFLVFMRALRGAAGFPRVAVRTFLLALFAFGLAVALVWGIDLLSTEDFCLYLILGCWSIATAIFLALDGGLARRRYAMVALFAITLTEVLLIPLAVGAGWA